MLYTRWKHRYFPQKKHLPKRFMLFLYVRLLHKLLCWTILNVTFSSLYVYPNMTRHQKCCIKYTTHPYSRFILMKFHLRVSDTGSISPPLSIRHTHTFLGALTLSCSHCFQAARHSVAGRRSEGGWLVMCGPRTPIPHPPRPHAQVSVCVYLWGQVKKKSNQSRCQT